MVLFTRRVVLIHIPNLIPEEEGEEEGEKEEKEMKKGEEGRRGEG